MVKKEKKAGSFSFVKKAGAVLSICGFGFALGIAICPQFRPSPEPASPAVIPWETPTDLKTTMNLLPYSNMPKWYEYYDYYLRDYGDTRKYKNKTISDYCIVEATAKLEKKRPGFAWIAETHIKQDYQVKGEAFLRINNKGQTFYEPLTKIQHEKSVEFKIIDSNPGETLVAIILIEKEEGEITAWEKSVNWYVK